MDDQEREIALCGYEEQGGRLESYWNNPLSFYLLTDQGTYKKKVSIFQAWKQTKRQFTQEEIVTGKWLKIGKHGYTFVVTFSTDGTLFEYDIFNAKNSNQGRWELVGSFLKTRVDQYIQDLSIQYELAVMANKAGSIHSGIESRSEENIVRKNAKVANMHAEIESRKQVSYTYFKVVHLG